MPAHDNVADVGFDFGTSTTLVATASGVVPLGTVDDWIPSLVGYDDTGDVVVGEAAMLAQPGQVIRSIKRAITDNRSSVRVFAPHGVRDVRADDLIAAVMRKAARQAFAHEVDVYAPGSVRLGCPAMWNGRQRDRLLAIAHQVGLPITLSTLVDEPVAAAIAWLSALPAPPPSPQRLLVFDMGGGTLDVAVVEVSPDGAARGSGVATSRLCVLSASGQAKAGDTLDDLIADDIDSMLRQAGSRHERTAGSRELLLDAARRAKIGLTASLEHPVVVRKDVFSPNEIWYTRDRLERAFSPLLDAAVATIETALRAALVARAAPDETVRFGAATFAALAETVDAVLLSGGMARIPCLKERLRAVFGDRTRIALATAVPEHAVVLGLANAGRFRWHNHFRPAFDISIELDGQLGRVLLYRAFTPLVEPYRILRGDTDLRFVVRGDEVMAGSGPGRLRIAGCTGQPGTVPADQSDLDGLPVVLGPSFELSVYPSGHVRVIDEQGTRTGNLPS